MPKHAPIHAVGYVEAGKLHLDNRLLFDAVLLRWTGRVSVTIESEELTRSDRAHRYYFGVVLKHIKEYTGHTIDELHEIFKMRWNSRIVFVTDLKTGEMTEVKIALSTTKLKVDEFYDYVENVRFDAAETFGVVTPDPDKDYWRKRDVQPTTERERVSA
jgi:hypothetical protein